MFQRLRLAGLVVLSQGLVATGIEFTGPTATPAALGQDFDAKGWTPRPTGGPGPKLRMGKLFPRQDEEDPSFCGYAEGDPGMAFLLPFSRLHVLCYSQVYDY
jgi:hypothetical protein